MFNVNSSAQTERLKGNCFYICKKGVKIFKINQSVYVFFSKNNIYYEETLILCEEVKNNEEFVVKVFM